MTIFFSQHFEGIFTLFLTPFAVDEMAIVSIAGVPQSSLHNQFEHVLFNVQQFLHGLFRYGFFFYSSCLGHCVFLKYHDCLLSILKNPRHYFIECYISHSVLLKWSLNRSILSYSTFHTSQSFLYFPILLSFLLLSG